MFLFTTLLGCSATDPLAVVWREEETTGADGVIGAAVAGSYVVGGLQGDLSVSTALLSVDGASPLALSAVADTTIERFCGCALFDAGANEVVVFGGRNRAFERAASAERIDLASGDSTPLDGAEDVGTIGCAAVFSDDVGLGYVFGGGRGPFSADTWRYDPTDGSLTLLDVSGPSARYDAGAVQLPDGDLLLVSGMSDGPTFHADAWRFDVQTETWSELPTSGDFEGRRFPFLSLGPDATHAYVGFGSDDPGGQSTLRDLWALELETGVFTGLDAEGPRRRAFALSLPGPVDSLGTMAFGSNDQGAVVDDAWTLWPQ